LLFGQWFTGINLPQQNCPSDCVVNNISLCQRGEPVFIGGFGLGKYHVNLPESKNIIIDNDIEFTRQEFVDTVKRIAKGSREILRRYLNMIADCAGAKSLAYMTAVGVET